VLVGEDACRVRLPQDRREKLRRDIPVEQPVAIFGKRRVIPHRRIHAHADEPAEQQVVIQLLDQQPLTSHAVQELQQQGAQQLLRRDRRAADLRIHRRESRRQRGQGDVGQPPYHAQRVISRHALLRRQVAEHITGLLIITTHASSLLKERRRSVVRTRYAWVPPELTFSTPC
jgi:hypothetical protein